MAQSLKNDYKILVTSLWREFLKSTEVRISFQTPTLTCGLKIISLSQQFLFAAQPVCRIADIPVHCGVVFFPNSTHKGLPTKLKQQNSGALLFFQMPLPKPSADSYICITTKADLLQHVRDTQYGIPVLLPPPWQVAGQPGGGCKDRHSEHPPCFPGGSVQPVGCCNWTNTEGTADTALLLWEAGLYSMLADVGGRCLDPS